MVDTPVALKCNIFAVKGIVAREKPRDRIPLRHSMRRPSRSVDNPHIRHDRVKLDLDWGSRRTPHNRNSSALLEPGVMTQPNSFTVRTNLSSNQLQSIWDVRGDVSGIMARNHGCCFQHSLRTVKLAPKMQRLYLVRGNAWPNLPA